MRGRHRFPCNLRVSEKPDVQTTVKSRRAEREGGAHPGQRKKKFHQLKKRGGDPGNNLSRC